MTFKEQFREYIDIVNAKLDELLPEKDNPQGNVYKAMRYSLLAGGKRIRPILTIAATKILGGCDDAALLFGCALEMIHTYSLIHDDLPAMDNDDLRRGRPTCHIEFDEATAILAGDALLNKAFEITSAAASGLPAENALVAVKAIAALSDASGAEGMIGGQIVDLESEGKEVDEETVRYMYKLKTGCLLSAPARMAAAISKKDDSDEAKRLIEYTDAIGLAFQIKDDILDIEGDTAKLGKATGRDEKEDKRSLARVKGIDYCKNLLSELTDKAISLAESFGEKGDFLKELAIFLLERDY